MSTALPTPPRQTRDQDRLEDIVRSRTLRKDVARTFFQGQFWFILKNVIGWTLMLLAGPIGVALPGPGGIPIFLVGFAMASIPGKRRITSHVMRGRPIRVQAGPYIIAATFLSVVAVLALLWFVQHKKEWLLDSLHLRGDPNSEIAAILVGISALAIIVVWIATRVAIAGVNAMLRGLPKARRMVKPWLRKYGIHLLPRRRRFIDGQASKHNENEILELDEHGKRRFAALGQWTLRWAIRAAVIGVAIYGVTKLVQFQRPSSGSGPGSSVTAAGVSER